MTTSLEKWVAKQQVIFIGQVKVTDQNVHVFVSPDFINMNFNELSHLVLLILKNYKDLFSAHW